MGEGMGKEIFQRKTAPNGAEYLSINVLDGKYPVKTFFTTKNGGVSGGPFTSQNMGFNTGDDPEKVKENRNRIFSSIGCPGYIVARPVQVHGSNIAVISDTGDGFADVPEDGILTFPDTDAVITDVENVILTSLHADCLPVWLFEPGKKAAGIVHAGWRGTRADIAALTAKKMCSSFRCRMSDIIAVVGPGISLCCFEVGREVYDEFRELTGDAVDEYVVDDKNGKYHMDLKGINKYLLHRAGVEQVYVSDYCTYCNEDLFYSYRRDGGITGRMCAGICITGNGDVGE